MLDNDNEKDLRGFRYQDLLKASEPGPPTSAKKVIFTMAAFQNVPLKCDSILVTQG